MKLKTYAEEKAEKERARARRAKRFIFQPVGIDQWENKHPEWVGKQVVKTQPYGAPRNGTMGHTYIASTEGEFIGLVLLNSLQEA